MIDMRALANGLLHSMAAAQSAGAPRAQPIPANCGRPHPQPYCCCVACAEARAKVAA